MVYTIHGVPKPEFESEPLYKIGYVLEGLTLRHVANRAAKVVAISSYVRELLRSTFGVDAAVIRNGVDSEVFYPPSARVRQSLRSSKGIPEGRHVVLFVGRLHRAKDPLTFVRCIPSVLARNSNSYFVMIGNGPSKNAVEREASHLGIRESLRLISHLSRPSLVEWFQASNIFVSASPWEMLGIAVLEAMSAGLPVIAPASGGPPEVLGHSGTLFIPGNHEDLAEKICSLLGDPRRAHEKAEAARDIILRDFRWDLVAGRYAALYRDAINASGPTRH
jgi:phosphatidylinositol alpha-1,6-mannosyltransferase